MVFVSLSLRLLLFLLPLCMLASSERPQACHTIRLFDFFFKSIRFEQEAPDFVAFVYCLRAVCELL